MVSYYKYKAFSSSLTKWWPEGLFSGELDNIYIYMKKENNLWKSGTKSKIHMQEMFYTFVYTHTITSSTKTSPKLTQTANKNTNAQL